MDKMMWLIRTKQSLVAKLNVFIHKHLLLTPCPFMSIFLSIRKSVVKLLVRNIVTMNTDFAETDSDEKLAGRTFSRLEN